MSNVSGALAVLDSHGLPLSDCTVAKKGRLCVTIAWTPRRVHFLDESVELVMHGKRSIHIHCNGTAVPSFGSNSPDENSPPNTVSPVAGLGVDTISMRSGSRSSGASCTSPSARMQRVQSRMRRSLSHIHEAFDDRPHSRSRAGSIGREPSAEPYNRRASIGREPSAEPYNRRASIGGASECSTGSRRSLSSASRQTVQPRLRTPQIQTTDAAGRRASLSSKSMRSIGTLGERREPRSRPQSARSVSAARQSRGSSAFGRSTSDRSATNIRGPPARSASKSRERMAPVLGRQASVRSSDNSASHLSAESLKKLSASLSPRKSMPQALNCARSRGYGQSTGYRAPSSGAPTLPVRGSRASSLRSTIHQMPSATPRHKEQTEAFAIYHTECVLSVLSPQDCVPCHQPVWCLSGMPLNRRGQYSVALFVCL